MILTIHQVIIVRRGTLMYQLFKLPAESVHAPVYEDDVFTVRGKGRFQLTALPGKSKKDRLIIEYFQY